MKTIRFVLAALTVAAAIPLLAGRTPAPNPGYGPCTATFTNTGVEGITDEGKGTYSSGVDGTQCDILKTDGSGTSGDFLFTLNYVRGAKTSRNAIIYLNNPVAGSTSRGVWVVGTLFHLKIKNLGDIPVGSTIFHRANFHVPYGGQNYKLRYAFVENDGTSGTWITRTSTSQWVVTSIEPHAARLWTGGAFGDPTVYEQQGDYDVPFTLTINLK